jgi:hypothetical protein
MVAIQSVTAPALPPGATAAVPPRLRPLQRSAPTPDSVRRPVTSGSLPAAAVALPAPGGDGSTKRPISPLLKGEVHLQVPHRYQGKEWSCGTSSLWMALQYHKPEGVDFHKLDNSVRPTRQFGRLFGTSPGALADYVARMDLKAVTKTHGTTYDLRRMLNQGLPVVLLGDRGSRTDPSMHYRVVTGYKGTDDRTATWTLRDALIEDGKELTFTTEELMAFWGNLAMFNLKIPFERPMVVIAPRDHQGVLPADNRSATTRLFDTAFKTAGRVLITAETVINLGRAKPKASAGGSAP